jgi:alkylation response protein AidB-like acyl-CoA dehydrogenase
VNFDYTEEQQLLANSVQQFIAREYTFEARQAIVESEPGYSEQVWSSLATMGLLGLPFSSQVGGFGGGAVDLMPVMAAIGEGLLVEPYLATVGLGGQFIARGGSQAQQQAILPALIEGTCKLAFAQTERGARYDLAHVGCRANKSDNGYIIEGEKCVVLHGPCADHIIVSARTAGDETDPSGISLFLVDRNAPGVSLNSYKTLDNLRAADIQFSSTAVPADALIGTEGQALGLIEEVTDYAIALLCAETVGAVKFANDTTLEYLKTRKQFGVPIGSPGRSWT